MYYSNRATHTHTQIVRQHANVRLQRTQTDAHAASLPQSSSRPPAVTWRHSIQMKTVQKHGTHHTSTGILFFSIFFFYCIAVFLLFPRCTYEVHIHKRFRPVKRTLFVVTQHTYTEITQTHRASSLVRNNMTMMILTHTDVAEHTHHTDILSFFHRWYFFFAQLHRSTRFKFSKHDRGIEQNFGKTTESDEWNVSILPASNVCHPT